VGVRETCHDVALHLLWCVFWWVGESHSVIHMAMVEPVCEPGIVVQPASVNEALWS
jgi:hypothetical protein